MTDKIVKYNDGNTSISLSGKYLEDKFESYIEGLLGNANIRANVKDITFAFDFGEINADFHAGTLVSGHATVGITFTLDK